MSNQRKGPTGLYLDQILDEARHLARGGQPPSDGIGVPRILEHRMPLLEAGADVDPLWHEEGDDGANDPRPVDRGTMRFTDMADRYRRMIEVYVSRTAGNA